MTSHAPQPPQIEPAKQQRFNLPVQREALKLLDVIPMGILITDCDDIVVYSNPAYLLLPAMPGIRLGLTALLQIIHPSDRSVVAKHLRQIKVIGAQEQIESRLTSTHEQTIWARLSSARLNLRSNESGVIHVIEDISKSKANAQLEQEEIAALAWEKNRASVTLECIGDAVISTDANGQVSYMNPVAEQLTGWTRAAARGQPFSQVFQVVHSGTRETVVNPAQRAIETGHIVQLAANSRLLRNDGSEIDIEDSAAPILDASGVVTGAVVIFRDRQFSRATASKMSHLARHDHLTGLVNRTGLSELFEQALKVARRRKTHLSVIFMDLDRFKTVNDSQGHKAGDQLLKDVALELTKSVRESDTVCRYGGDEFLVLLSEIDKVEDAIQIAKNMSKAVNLCLKRNQCPSVGLSLGISIYPTHGDNPELLIQRADCAMYEAKGQGGGSLCLFQTAPVLP